MASPLREDVDLIPVFKKLGHKLEEIRTRALQNLLSKLEHGVICDGDLTQHHHLHVRLLEWFNYDRCACKAEVLQLIKRLTKKDGSAAGHFLEIGAVDFLAKLRADSEESLQAIVDDIVENLLSLPSQEPAARRKECTYQHQAVPQDERPGDPHQGEEHAQHNGRRVAEPSHQQGYFTSCTAQHNNQNSAANSVVGCVRGLRFTTFPWLSLTPTDRHVLSSTHSSLCSPRPSLVLTSCDFVSDVILQDFPAEIFLQRPSIAKSLLSLLGVQPLGTGDHSILLSAVKCLRDLSSLLLSRYKFYHDPALYCPKQDFGSQTISTSTGRASYSTGQSTLSSGSRPSVIGRSEPRVGGDGRDGDTPSSVGSSPSLADLSAGSGSETDSEGALILQFSQLTLPQFAADALSQGAPLLKSSHAETAVASVHLLSEAAKLATVSMTTEIWEDDSVAARALTDKLSDSFETLGEVVHYHYHHCHGDDDDPPTTAISDQSFDHHRLSVIAVVTLVSKLIQDLVPMKKAKDIIPESLSTSLYLAVMDQALLYCIPGTRPTLVGVLEACLPGRHRMYRRAAEICQSMDSACTFLRSAERKDMSSKDLLALAQGSLRGLAHHRVPSLPARFVELCSDIHSSSSISEELGRQSRQVLLSFLSHPDSDIRSQTYAACLKIVKDVISVANASAGQKTDARRLHFLLDAHTLYQVCCYGLDSTDAKVCSQAAELMLHLLQGQLLMGPDAWAALLQACLPVLPILQAVCEKSERLQESVLGLVRPSSLPRPGSKTAGSLPSLERLRGSLRLLLHPDQSVRLEGAKSVMYFLCQDLTSSSRLPRTDAFTVTDLTGLLLADHPISLDSLETGRSVFQVDGLLQVWGIFTSARAEAGLRKSALDQIAIILQDTSLHKAFISHGGLDRILDCLLDATKVSPDGASQQTSPMVPACLCILRHVLHADAALRHRLAHRDGIYHSLIRATLLCSADPKVRYHTSHVLVLLLFDEVAALSIDEHQSSTQFSLPKCIIQKYKLPFRCPVSKAVYPRHQPDLSVDDGTLDQSPVTRRMLRTAWNVAWHGGLAATLRKIRDGELDQSKTSFSGSLAFTKEDLLILRCSHVTTSLDQCLTSVRDGASHYAVKLALCRLSLWLLTDALLTCSSDSVSSNSSSSSSIAESLLQLQVKEALGRFLEVFPATVADKGLLADVLAFLELLVRSLTPASHPDPGRVDFLHWLGNAVCGPKAALVGLLNPPRAGVAAREGRDGQTQADADAASQRALHKQLVAFFGSYARCLPLSSEAWRRKTGYLGGGLTHGLLRSLNSADATHFYDLPSLESTLHTLVHVTARPGWSLDWSEGDSLSLCQLLLNSLLEVISAFHIGRGGTAMSFMGKGVTKCATVCLCHLAHEMAYKGHQNWSSGWAFSRQGPDGPAEIGLDWLIPLWSYRDPEVRAAGLGIAVVLSSCEAGRVTMTTGCQHLPGGLWAVALGIFLDQSECSIVRHQAALLLVNLLNRRLSTEDLDKEIVTVAPALNSQQQQQQQGQPQVSSLPALHALLTHYDLHRGVADSLGHFYGRATIQPVSVVEDSTVTGSSLASGLSTASTPDFCSSRSTTRSSLAPSPVSLVQPVLMNGVHPQRAVSSVESGQHSSAPLLGTGTGSSSSQSCSSTVVSPTPPGRYLSVVTPCLVSALCRLLRNLLALSPSRTRALINTEGIAAILIRLVDVGCIQDLLRRLAVSSSSLTRRQLHDHLLMCRSIMSFFQAYHRRSRDQSPADGTADRPPVGVDGADVLSAGCRLLDISSSTAQGSCDWQHIHSLWESVFAMMYTHVTGTDREAMRTVLPVLTSHWGVITGALLHILNLPTPSPTRLAALAFLSGLMAELAHRQRPRCPVGSQGNRGDHDDDEGIVADMMRELDDREESPDLEEPAGSRLCCALLRASDGTVSRPSDDKGSSAAAIAEEKSGTVAALRNLLAVSQRAKKTAIESGMIESVLDSVRHTHAKLNAECLQHPRAIAKKKEEPLLLHLISQMGLLQNCLCDSQEAKLNSLEAGLTTVLQKLWSWSLLDNKLLLATLSLLVAYTAKCTSACSSLAQCSPGQSGSSLLHRLIQLGGQRSAGSKAPNGQSKDDHQLTTNLFAVLCNAATSAECRNVMWKSGFLQNVTKLMQPLKRTSNSRQSVAGGSRQTSGALWLRLLASLTFSPEGQQMVMRIPEILDSLLQLGESGTDEVEYLSTLTLHNLCFLSANKPKLLASETNLAFFEAKLLCGRKSLQNLAAHALWALLYGSQKAKAILKSSSLSQSLLNVQTRLATSPPQSQPSISDQQGGVEGSLCQAVLSAVALMKE